MSQENRLPGVEDSKVAAEESCDEPLFAEEQYEAEGHHYAGHDEGHRQNRPKEPLSGKLVVGEEVRPGEAYREG